MLFPEMSFSLTFFSHRRAYFIQSQLFTSFQNYIPIQKEKQSTFSKETIDNVNFSKSYWLQAGELFWFGVKKLVFCYQNCSDLLWEKIVPAIEKNFEIRGWKPRICKILRSLEQFTQTVKVQNNFGNKTLFKLDPGGFLYPMN